MPAASILTADRSRHRRPAGTLRLSMSSREQMGTRGVVDGVWWPHSHDLGREGAQLLDQFPGGRVVEIGYAAADWDVPVRHIVTGHGRVRAFRLRPNSRRGMVLRLDDDRLLGLAVVHRTPPTRPAAVASGLVLGMQA